MGALRDRADRLARHYTDPTGPVLLYVQSNEQELVPYFRPADRIAAT